MKYYIIFLRTLFCTEHETHETQTFLSARGAREEVYKIRARCDKQKHQGCCVIIMYLAWHRLYNRLYHSG